MQSLARIAEVVHGAPSRFTRFSFAHGGKDGHPFPVPLKTYDESLGVLRRSLEAARLGQTEKIHGFKRLDQLARTVENECQPFADFNGSLEQERATSPSFGGRTVFDDKRKPRLCGVALQQSLF